MLGTGQDNKLEGIKQEFTQEQLKPTTEFALPCPKHTILISRPDKIKIELILLIAKFLKIQISPSRSDLTLRYYLK